MIKSLQTLAQLAGKLGTFAPDYPKSFGHDEMWDQVERTCDRYTDYVAGYVYDPEVLYHWLLDNFGVVDLARLTEAQLREALEVAYVNYPENWSGEEYDAWIDSERASADLRAQLASVAGL